MLLQRPPEPVCVTDRLDAHVYWSEAFSSVDCARLASPRIIALALKMLTTLLFQPITLVHRHRLSQSISSASFLYLALLQWLVVGRLWWRSFAEVEVASCKNSLP